MKHILILACAGLVLFGLSACETKTANLQEDPPVTEQTPEPAPTSQRPLRNQDAFLSTNPDNPSDTCGLSQWEPMVGKDISTMRIGVGKRIRIISPGDQVTMDFVPERLNIYVNDENIITEIKCG